MPEGVGLLPLWLAHVTEASIEFGAFALIAMVMDRLLTRFTAPELRTALWLAVLVKLLAPGAFPKAWAWTMPLPELAESTARAAAGPHSTLPAWAPLAFGLWLAGVLLLATTALLRYRSLRRRRWIASEPVPAFVEDLAKRIAKRLGLTDPVPVRSFAGPGGPALLGFRRPTVLLPQSLWEAPARDDLEMVLLHELAHVRRRDPWWALFCVVVQVLYWFHPLVWFTRRRLSALRELACDQSVGRALDGDTQRYRRTLLTRPWSAEIASGGLAFLRSRSQLVVRLRALEHPIPTSVSRLRLQGLLLFGLLSGCGLVRPPAAPVPYPYDLPPLEDLRGCLPLRYAVLSMKNHAETVEGSELAPLLRPPATPPPSQAP